jgi:hypothetical protein
MKASAAGRWLVLLAALLSGCEGNASLHPATQPDLFVPTAMRIQPNFTQVSSWTHSGKPDGIEAHLEFTDQFGDPTKATGRVLFELFEFRRDSPDPRGKRIIHWVGSLATLDEQRERWNTTLRTYRFQLDDPAVDSARTYVLWATFELATGGRFFDHIVLQGHPAEKTEKKQGVGLGVE